MFGDLVEKLENFIQEYFFANSVYTLSKEIVFASLEIVNCSVNRVVFDDNRALLFVIDVGNIGCIVCIFNSHNSSLLFSKIIFK